MKYNTFLFCVLGAVAIAGICVETVNGANPPYILVAGTDGKLPIADSGYPTKVPMTEVSNLTYEAKGVEIDNGFVFLGESSTSASYSLYSMPSWAVNPIVVGMYNPVGIATSTESLIKVAPGKYDVVFVARDLTGTGFHMFKLEPANDVTAESYPEAMYMVTSQSVWIKVPGSDGVYEADVTLPESFRVAYEPRYDVSTFIYGPATASDNLLTNGVALPLVYMDNATVNIGYAPATDESSALAAGKECHVAIDIRKGSESIKAQLTSTSAIDGVTTDSDIAVTVSGGVVNITGAEGTVKELYSLSGSVVYRGMADAIGPCHTGFYMLRVGDKVHKVTVR